MSVTDRTTEFDTALDGWVRAAFARGVRTFTDLVRALPGVYPVDALRSVARLGHELPSGWNTLPVSSPPDTAEFGWPVEHPLDFDWRFTQDTVRFLLDRCRHESSGPITFLGAPSLAWEAAASGWAASVSLFDRNLAVVEGVRSSYPNVAARCVDLVWGEPVGASDAAVVVADPPWYPEHILAFLWAAGRLAASGGRVFISMPPVGTRPGILAERDAIFTAAAAFGLRAAPVRPGVLTYRTPLFEKNALAAAGVTAPVPWDWRRGDLAEFIVEGNTGGLRPTPSDPLDEWDEVAIGVVRIKCRRSPRRGFLDPTLSPAAAGDILPTVSRRDPARSSADVWTCGNRVFKCKGAGVFGVIASALGRHTDVHEEVAGTIRRLLSPEERELVKRAADQAMDLVQVEESEIQEGPAWITGAARNTQERVACQAVDRVR